MSQLTDEQIKLSIVEFLVKKGRWVRAISLPIL